MKTRKCCDSKDAACNGNRMIRRDFLRTMGSVAAGAAIARLPVMAGPFDDSEFRNLVPLDKKLQPEWVKSLYERGQPDIFSGADLRTIGMPVGGIACGQLYLGGDGRLWYWDLFKSRTSSDNNLGVHYAKPMVPDEKVPHSFAVRIRQSDGQTLIRTLRQGGFGQVSFRGEYPVGRVTYADPTVPVEVQLTAYSPFIPLNLEDSALPGTIMSYSVRNKGPVPLEVDIAGWMQNAIPVGGINRASKGSGAGPAAVPDGVQAERRNRVETRGGLKAVVFAARPVGAASQHAGESLALSILGDNGITGCADVGAEITPAKVFEALARRDGQDDAKSAGRPLTGAVGASLRLLPGETRAVHFLLTWFFPRYTINPGPGKIVMKISLLDIPGFERLQRRYAVRFSSALTVAEYMAANFGRLSEDTLTWNTTWYDSTLPYWFLDRTFLTIDCLATQTVHWFDNGRFWAWEGVDCCAGTCQHVWHYAQGPGRIFPQFERDLRERVDFGLAWHENGATDYRGDSERRVAHDGHLGTILRAYREHQVSRDDLFLRRIWPRVRKSIEFAISWDRNGDGLVEGEQFNTCDASWYGPMGWISSLFVAALRAGEAMALEMGDRPFAEHCRRIAERGTAELVKQLYNGEYFIHKPDPSHPEATNTNDGCHIDQCQGQALAWQFHLPRVTPEKESRSALDALWKYNFTPDAGAHHEKMLQVTKPTRRRWYALAGEAGMVMTTFPKGGVTKATGESGFAHYFSEAWTGQEHQVAAHMIREGMLEKGLAVIRAVHDRHHASRRNPYNEVECSYHYSRAMASYGSFLAISGFEYHGPKGHIGFAPKLTPADFKCAFTAAEGWGTYRQKTANGKMEVEIAVRWGQVAVKTLALAAVAPPQNVQVTLAGILVNSQFTFADGRMTITLPTTGMVKKGQMLAVRVS